MFCSSRMIFYWFCRLFAMTERRNIKYMRAFILSLISLYIIYATYFVDMQDDYFNNKKMSVLTCRRYLIDLKIEACSLANGFWSNLFMGNGKSEYTRKTPTHTWYQIIATLDVTNTIYATNLRRYTTVSCYINKKLLVLGDFRTNT